MPRSAAGSSPTRTRTGSSRRSETSSPRSRRPASRVTTTLLGGRSGQPHPDRPSGDPGGSPGHRGDVRQRARSTSAKAGRSRCVPASPPRSGCRSSCSGSPRRRQRARAERMDGPRQLRRRHPGDRRGCGTSSPTCRTETRSRSASCPIVCRAVRTGQSGWVTPAYRWCYPSADCFPRRTRST